MHNLYKLRDMLVKELEGYGSIGELSKASLDSVNKLSHAAKNVCKVITYCNEEGYADSTVEDKHYQDSKERLREELRKMLETF